MVREVWKRIGIFLEVCKYREDDNLVVIKVFDRCRIGWLRCILIRLFYDFFINVLKKESEKKK